MVGEHELQRPRRAKRFDAGRRVSLFRGNRNMDVCLVMEDCRSRKRSVGSEALRKREGRNTGLVCVGLAKGRTDFFEDGFEPSVLQSKLLVRPRSCWVTVEFGVARFSGTPLGVGSRVGPKPFGLPQGVTPTQRTRHLHANPII